MPTPQLSLKRLGLSHYLDASGIRPHVGRSGRSMSGLRPGRSDVSLIRFGERNVATANALQKTQLERSQKIQQILLILRPQPEELSHDSVRLRARAPVFSDRLNQILGATVMKEE